MAVCLPKDLVRCLIFWANRFVAPRKSLLLHSLYQTVMNRIFLVGYMGAGKTTIGKVLSKLIGLTFIDLDYYIEGRFRKTVAQLFAERGEEGFRSIERNMLHEVAEFEDVLVSTGGGTPCFFDNMEFMNQQGTTIYLQVSVDELASRLEVCKHTRPVLKNRTGDELKAFVAESLSGRLPFYQKASIVFDANELMTEADAYALSEQLKKLIEP